MRLPFADLSKDISKYRLEVVDETYGYNQSKFGCSSFKEDLIYWVEMNIYHFNEAIYEWKMRFSHIVQKRHAQRQLVLRRLFIFLFLK